MTRDPAGEWLVGRSYRTGYAYSAEVFDVRAGDLVDGTPVASVIGKERAHVVSAALELLAAGKALLAWGQEHTSPTDPNGPHELLVAMAEAVAKAEDR